MNDEASAESQTLLARLLVSAERVLALQSDDAFLQELESYTQLFNQWQGSSATATSEAQRVELERLQTAHAAILARAERIMGGIAQELRDLKKKGKGILAYTDLMPKRWGALRPRKG